MTHKSTIMFLLLFPREKSMKSTENRTLKFLNVKSLQKMLFSLLFLGNSAFAEQQFIDIGYTPGNSSLTESINFGVYGLHENKPMYMNFNIGLTPSDYIDSTSTYGTASDIKQVPLSINIGRTFSIVPDSAKMPIYKSIHSYLGIGYASLSGVAKYTSSGTDLGYYNYPSKDKSGLNLNGGLIFVFNTFGLNIGVNSFTKSAYLNIGILVD